MPDTDVIDFEPEAAAAASSIDFQPLYETALNGDEEPRFQQWKQRYAPNDSGNDYDLRGAFKAGLRPDPVTGHWPDTYKKPNHPTFSDQSIYAPDVPGAAGKWQGETFVPPTIQFEPDPTTDPKNQWWWQRFGRGVEAGFTETVGRLAKSPLGQAFAAVGSSGGGFSPAADAYVDATDPGRRQTAAAGMVPIGQELQRRGQQISEATAPGVARTTGEIAGGIVPYVAAEATAGPTLMLPMLFADGYQQHMDAAAAKGKDGTNTALAGGALNMALGLPVFKVVRGVARAIAPNAAEAVQETIRRVYQAAGIQGVEKLVGALQSQTAYAWTKDTAEALLSSLKSLDAEIKNPVTTALQRVVKQAAQSASIGGAVTTGHNLLAQSYDPDRPTFEKVPEALLNFGVMGALGATGEAARGVKSARQAADYLRQKYHEKPVMPSEPAGPPAQIDFTAEPQTDSAPPRSATQVPTPPTTPESPSPANPASSTAPPMPAVSWSRPPMALPPPTAVAPLALKSFDQVPDDLVPTPVPAEPAAPPPPRRFQIPYAPLGQPDIIDVIHENGGVASRSSAGPAAAAHNADLWDDQPDLRGVYRQILGGRLMPDQMAAIAQTHGHGDGSVATFWNDVSAAVAARRSVRTQNLANARAESAANTQDQRFAKEVLKPGDAPEAINTSNLQVGDVMSVGDHQFKVTEIDPDTLDVTLEDGKRYGVQHVADGQAVYVDKTELVPREQDTWQPKIAFEPDAPPTLRPRESGTGELFQGADQPFNLAGEQGIDYGARRREAEAAAVQAEQARRVQEQQQTRIPGMQASIRPPVTGFELGPPPPAPPSPADDPGFTAFPVDLPEAVRFGQELLGVAIQVKKKLRALAGNAAGVFRHTDGPAGKAEIHLRADIADLLTPEDKAKLEQEAMAYAKRVADTPDEIAKIAKERYEFMLDQAYQEAKTRPPVLALKVIWHEIGHAVDWFPQKIIAGRGNLFGHIAALHRHLSSVIALDPKQPAGKPIDQRERRALMKQAEEQLHKELGPIEEIVETIMVEEPELRIVGITPADIKNLFGMDARETLPELYKWFAEQTTDVKRQIVRKAMRDVLDDRLSALGKTEQIGVKRTERTVRKKVGREPTVEEIRERFRKLFRDELKRRNLAHLTAVKQELRDAIAWWHGAPEMPAYFSTGTEMYAEAFSIFMNNPAALQKRAPTFARLLWNYLDARPEASALYNRIQNEIKAGQVEDNTEQAMLDSWDAADERSLELAKPHRTTLRDFLDNVSYHMDRRFGPIYRAAKGSPLEPRVRAAIGDFLYRASEHELFLSRMNRLVGQPLVAANLDWKDLGRFMFYSRVIEERFKIFNPYGIAPDRALKRLAKMKQAMGPTRWQALQNAQRAFRALYEEHVITAMEKARLWNKELQEMINMNVFYATFDVRQDDPMDGIGHLLNFALGGNVGPHIYRQIGTVKEIKNPATATVLKSLSLISAAARNIAKRETIQMLLLSDPQNVLEAEKRWTGKRWEYVPRDNAQVGTVVYLDEGKPQAYYVRAVVAEALNKGTSIDNRLVLAAVQATSALKGLFTQLNYAFWPVNFVRDTFGWVLQMPRATPIGWAREFPAAMAAARASVKGRRNQAAEAALQRRMLISRADPHGVWSAVDNEFELKLASYGLDPAMWSREADRVHTLVKIWNSYREFGQQFERVNKIAAMNYLDRKFPNMPEWQKREIVRERGGSPDFMQRGASNAYVDFFMMFYNPWKEGARSVGKSARENPWSFAAKAVAFILLPTMVQALAAVGIFGDELRRLYRSIPDYDLTNYLIIPLGWADKEQGKAAYLRFPLWEPARILHGTLWGFASGRGQGLGGFYGGTLPSMNVMLNTARMWMDYEVFGHNPYDSFRGKTVLSDTEFAAGGWQAREQLLKQSWNNMGGSLLYRFQNTNLENPATGSMEKFLQLPIISNALNRWVKVSNRGLDDEDRQLTAPVQQQRAQTRLAVQEITRKMVDGEALVDSEKKMLWDPYALEYLRRTLPETVIARSSPFARRLQGKGPAERGVILQGMIKDQIPAGAPGN